MKDPKAIRRAIMTARNIAAMVDPNFARVPLPQIGEPDPEEEMQPEQFSMGGRLPARRSDNPFEQFQPQDPFSFDFPDHQYAAGGGVDDHVVNNPMSVFPKPQRMFDEDMPGGAYLSMPDKEDVTGHRAAQASIGIGEGGKPYFHASRDETDETGSPGKGSALVKTNLFKQRAGWRWLDVPEGHEGTGTIVSVEHRGKHHYVMDAHFPNGVDLSRYPDAPSEPRLRPTTRGNVELGPQVGSILVRGREHPVHSHAIVREYGGRVGYAGGGMPDDDQELTGYHGSANEFPEFSMGARGRGQGQAAFGEGHNFAEDEDVARRYRNMTAREHMQGDVVDKYTGEVLPNDAPEAELFRDAVRYGDRDLSHRARNVPHTIAAYKKSIQEYDDYRGKGNDDSWIDKTIEEMHSKIDALQRFAEIAGTHKFVPKGHMYEVGLRVSPSKLLKWHEPVSEQPEELQRHLIESGVDYKPDWKGRDIYSHFMAHPDNDPEFSPKNKYSGELANQILSDIGVHGIQWKDTDSQIAPGSGKNNYTIWDDSRIKTRRRYALGGMPDDDEQPPDYAAPDKMGLYSHAAATAANLPQAKASPEEFRKMLVNLPNIKESEFKASGYDQAFADQPQVTREQVAEHFHQNRTPIEEKRFYDNNPQLDALEKDYWDKLREVQARKVAHHEANPDQDNTGWGNEEKAALRDDYHKARAAVLESKDYIQSAGNTHHEGYTLPGGENYREVLLKHGGDDVIFPGDDNHFGKEPNILSHLLMKDRTDVEGKKLLHLDELQSDWAQKGRQEGFSGPIDEDRFQRLNSTPDSVRTADEDAELTDMFKKLQGVSTAPYVTKTDDWVDLGLKRAMMEAAKGGHDKLAWTPGDVVADRYNLSKHISNIHHEKNDDGTYNIVARNHRGATVYDQDDLAEKDVVNALGKDVAGKIFSGEGVGREEAQARIKSAQKAYEEFKDKLIETDMQRRLEVRRQGNPNFNWDDDQEERLKEILREGIENSGIHTYAEKMGLHDEHQPLYNELRNANSAMNSSPYSPYRDWRTLSGVDLTIGGEGMKKFYDEMVPKRLMKLAKQHDPDAKFSVSNVKHPAKASDDYYNEDRPEENTDLPTLEITPKMRESILKKGFAAYADGGEVEGYAEGGDVDPARVREYLKRIQSPLSDNPASVQRALQIAQSYRGKTGAETGTGSFYNIKQSMPVSDVRATIGDIPGISLKKENPLSWDKFHDIAKGGSLINMGGDLSNFGRLTHINDKELSWPVDLHAGAKYMREPNPGQVWRNNKSHATGFANKIKAEEAAGRDVYGILSPMGPTAVNSSHNMFDALMAQIPTSNIKKADFEAFDEALLNGEHLPADVRKNPAQFARAMQGLDQWPGIENAKAASDYARPKAGKLSGNHRSLIVDFMDKSRWRDRGFPEVGVTRAAITDPELKGISGNLLGHRVVKLSSKDSEQPELFDHSTYEKPSFGEYVGDVPLTQRHYVMPDVVERMIANPTQKGQVVHPYSEDAMGRSTARKLFEEQKQVQPVNQRMLDSVMTGMENQNKYGFKKGGKVRSALMIAKGLKKR